MIDSETAKGGQNVFDNLENNTFDISADEPNLDFDPEEDTDLNEDELDEDASRKMSIRAINVGTMHRFSPGSMTLGRR